jgi:hypothetical protein
MVESRKVGCHDGAIVPVPSCRPAASSSRFPSQHHHHQPLLDGCREEILLVPSAVCASPWRPFCHPAALIRLLRGRGQERDYGELIFLDLKTCRHLPTFIFNYVILRPNLYSV